MSDYTPTTDDVVDAWCSRYDSERTWAGGEERRGYESEFYRRVARTLREAKAEAWEEGHRAGQHNEHEYRPGRAITNPYRQEQDA